MMSYTHYHFFLFCVININFFSCFDPCTLQTFVMWSKKTHHMVQNWYIEFLVSNESFNYSHFGTFYLDLLWNYYQKLQLFKGCIKIKKNIRILMFISFILQFHFLQHVTGFPRSHHILWSFIWSTKSQIIITHAGQTKYIVCFW